jgi:myo-inositol-1(or 4)-monophosphatase
MTDLGALADLAERIAHETGRMLVAARAAGVRDVGTKSSITDLVTEHDRAAEELISSRLSATRPDDSLMGEEGTARQGTSGVRWVVDPIDGTTNFWYGLPGWSISIAAADDDGPAVGVVHAPTTGETFRAVRGGGATRNGQPIAPSACTDLAAALVGTGFAYRVAARERQGHRIAHLLPRVRDIRRLGSAAMDLCYAASGRLDVYFEEHLGAWDVAAGLLIAREAGCVTSDLLGGPARPEAVLVAGPGIHAEFLAALRAADSR